MPKEPKYNVGDTVYYRNGKYGVQTCKVESVSTGYQGSLHFFPYDEPIYTIRWQPTGHAVAHESSLFNTAEAAA